MNGSSSHKTSLLASEQEAEILSRVEESLVLEFRKMHASPTLSFQDQVRTWMAWGAGTVAAAAAVLLLVVQPWQSSPLLLEGGAIVAQGHRASQDVVPVEVKQGKTGALSEAKRWKISMAQRTRLALVKTEKSVRTVRLQRGFVQIHVHKGSMKRFVVESEDVQVVVTGTIFSVERETKWIRVELFRGSVKVNHKGHQQRVLVPGEGVRINLINGSSRKYRFPLTKKKQPSLVIAKPQKQTRAWERLRLLVHQRRLGEMHRYALDLAESRQYSKQERLDMLRWAVKQEFSHQRRNSAIQTLLVMASLGGEGSAVQFGDAINTCRSLFWEDRSHCFRMTRRFMKTYPKSLGFRDVACNYVDDLVKYSKPKLAGRSLQIATTLFHQNRCKELLCPGGSCSTALQSLFKDE